MLAFLNMLLFLRSKSKLSGIFYSTYKAIIANMKFKNILHIIIATIILGLPLYSQASSRIKDIVYVEGIRDNMLVGYGLVVGLNGTGDNLKNSAFTKKGLVNFLEKLGVNTRGSDLKTKNIAAVMVTVTLPAFSRPGSRISIDISTMGDAKSIKGGTLLATPLLGPDGEVYAVAQGNLSIGMPTEIEKNKQKIIPTSGYIQNGAIVEREVDFKLNSLNKIKFALKNYDITTARAIATSINASMRQEVATPDDPGTVTLKVPAEYQNNVVGLLADIENLTVTPDSIAKIIVDEATGTIVIGENVKVSTVAISQGNLIVEVSDEEKFAQQFDEDDNQGKTQEPGKKFAVLEKTANLKDLVHGLNSLGVHTKDLIAILKTIKYAGVLQAEIEVR